MFLISSSLILHNQEMNSAEQPESEAHLLIRRGSVCAVNKAERLRG